MDVESFLNESANEVSKLRAYEVRTFLKSIETKFASGPEDEAVFWSSVSGRMLEHGRTKSVRQVSGEAAVEAYLSQESRDLIVVSKTHFRGWRCQCESPPPLHTLDCWTIVAPPDTTWFFTRIKDIWSDIGERLGRGTVFGHCWFSWREGFSGPT